MPHRHTRHVTDVASLRAIAHPLRVRLLAALRIDGPATASELARKLGESSGSTSYHLRQLARYGFIEEDPEQPNARDRRWRAVHAYTSWRDSDFADQPEGLEASRWLRARAREHFAATAERFESESWSPEWRDAAGHSNTVLRLTPRSLRELHDRVLDLAHEYAVRDADAPDTEQVALFFSGFPIREYLD